MSPLTKTRAALLKLFFTNPERSFYMQEIGRIMKIDGVKMILERQGVYH